MALNCSHMFSSVFVVRSLASSSGPVTGPAEYTKDCSSTEFMWQTWNVKGRPLDLCLCTMEDTNTKSVEWQRRFILPVLLTALTYWSCQHLTTVGAFSLSPVPSLLLSPSSACGTCSSQKLFKLFKSGHWIVHIPAHSGLAMQLLALTDMTAFLSDSYKLPDRSTTSCFLISLYLLGWACYMPTVTVSGLLAKGIQCSYQHELTKR